MPVPGETSTAAADIKKFIICESFGSHLSFMIFPNRKEEPEVVQMIERNGGRVLDYDEETAAPHTIILMNKRTRVSPEFFIHPPKEIFDIEFVQDYLNNPEIDMEAYRIHAREFSEEEDSESDPELPLQQSEKRRRIEEPAEEELSPVMAVLRVVPSPSPPQLPPPPVEDTELPEECEDELPKEEPKEWDGITFQGFKTASGKDCKISEEALKRVESLFTDIEKNPDALPQKKSLIAAKAASLSTPISAKGFKIPTRKRSLNDINTENNKTPTPPRLGFSTASGKKVEVSEESLRIVRNGICASEGILEELVVIEQKPSTSVVKNMMNSTPKMIGIPRRSSTKFKPPLRREASSPPRNSNKPTLINSPGMGGMTQEIDDCMKAFFEDEDDQGF